MRKILLAATLGSSALLGAGAHAAPAMLAIPVPALAPPHVQAADWNDWRRDEWRRHEERERWHRWHEEHERARYYGYGR